ncbi:hypothetical protein OSB04_029341 [Centaurea solstitialis]|uniref:CCHC-type domain-containing protein n=1 Tax=Centaurea solstitialis TaxID=347529 RepID=A0AA38SHG9_9ASTR|nr:hypothetical protein OSB04_029341 [Centaurea solstitialis]
MASTVTSTNNLSLRSILEKDKLTGPNFLDWERNLMIVLRHERKWYVLEEPLGEAPPATAPAAARNAHKKHSDDLLDVACLMLATMSPDLQAGLINTNAYDMIRQLRDMFQTQARTECYDATKAFNECKMIKGTSVSDHVMKMKRHLDHLERLGHPVPLQLATDTILNSLSDDYKPFVVNYNMNNMEKSIAELHSMLKTTELNMGTKNKTKDVLMVRDGGVKKKNRHTSTSKGKGPVQAVQSAPKKGKSKGKGKKVKPNKARTENRCFTCNEVGHWRQNCPKRHEAVLLEEQFVGRSLVDQFSSNPDNTVPKTGPMTPYMFIKSEFQPILGRLYQATIPADVFFKLQCESLISSHVIKLKHVCKLKCEIWKCEVVEKYDCDGGVGYGGVRWQRWCRRWRSTMAAVVHIVEEYDGTMAQAVEELRPSQIKKAVNAIKSPFEVDVTSKQCADILAEQKKQYKGNGQSDTIEEFESQWEVVCCKFYTRKIFELFKKVWNEATNNLTHETLSKSAEESSYRVGQVNVEKKFWRIVKFCFLKEIVAT